MNKHGFKQECNWSQFYQVVRDHQGTVNVLRQNNWPEPSRGFALVRMVACGLCGADVRISTGNKTLNIKSDHPIVLGHEGVGIIIGMSEEATEFKCGDFVVVLPHIYPPRHAQQCSFGISGGPRCIGFGHTRHMGFDVPGVFADLITAPISNLIRVPTEHLQQAADYAPYLPYGAIFSLVEPMLCVLSAYSIMEQESMRFLHQKLVPGRAVVLGAGPIGYLLSLVLLNYSWRVSIADAVWERAELLRTCLNDRVQLLDPADKGFDLAVIAASSASAIRQAEALIRNRGLVYIFAGLNTADRSVMDEDLVIVYERIHRIAQPVMKMTRGKIILYAGSSGYWDDLAPRAIDAVAMNATELAAAVTGFIHGWSSSRIESRLGENLVTKDGAPAIMALLNGADLRQTHIKLLALLACR